MMQLGKCLGSAAQAVCYSPSSPFGRDTILNSSHPTATSPMTKGIHPRRFHRTAPPNTTPAPCIHPTTFDAVLARVSSVSVYVFSGRFIVRPRVGKE